MVKKSQGIFLSAVAIAAGIITLYATDPLKLGQQTGILLTFAGFVGLAYFGLGEG